MKQAVLTGIAVIAIAVPALAQQPADPHAGHAMPSPESSKPAQPATINPALRR